MCFRNIIKKEKKKCEIHPRLFALLFSKLVGERGRPRVGSPHIYFLLLYRSISSYTRVYKAGGKPRAWKPSRAVQFPDKTNRQRGFDLAYIRRVSRIWPSSRRKLGRRRPENARNAKSGKQPSKLIPTLLNVSHINRIKAITPAKLRNISYLRGRFVRATCANGSIQPRSRVNGRVLTIARRNL